MGTPMGRDGCPRAPEACTARRDADSHAVPWLQASGAKDRSIQGSRTPMGFHGYGQTGIWMHRSAGSRAPMRSHEYKEAGARKAPFARCDHPWDLMAAGKRGEGCRARGQGSRSWGPIDSGMRREGCTPSRAAPAHASSSTRGSDRRGAAITTMASRVGGLRYPHRREASTDRPDGRLASRT